MVVCLFKFGKLSTMKHTVASVPGRLNYYSIGDNITTRHCTCDIPSVYITITIHRLRPRDDNFCATNVCVFILLAKFAKLIVRKHF